MVKQQVKLRKVCWFFLGLGKEDTFRERTKAHRQNFLKYRIF